MAATISASLVKQLREKTGAGMMDCKKALIENDGDIEAATDWLRKKGLAAAAKKSGRVASEGLVGLVTEGTCGAVVEVNSETDFVARNETFQALVREAATIAPAAKGDVDALAAHTVSSGRTLADEIKESVGVIGENMSLRRTAYLEVSNGVVAGYMHGQLSDGLGKIGVLVGLESTGNSAALSALGKQIAMHIAATNPQSVTIEAMDQAVVDRERAIYSDQARASGKPENIIEKMVEGRLRKFYEESVLLEQVFVIDTDKKVKQAIEAVAKDIGAEIKVTGFVRMMLGEGIEKQESDLASEVAQMVSA
jgi:elongation factor Ts